MLDQKIAFDQRLKRISTGKQVEAADVVGHRIQKRYEKKYGTRAERNRRPIRDGMMLIYSLIGGAGALLGGRLIYFHASKFEGLPESFYKLEGKGVLLATLVLVAILVVFLGVQGKGRMPALFAGLMLMYFGEAAVAANATDLWAQLFSPEYASELAARGADYVVTPAG